MLVKTGMLFVFPTDHPTLKHMSKQTEGEYLTSAQYKQRFPAVSGIPEDTAAFFSYEAGIIRVKEALAATKKLA